MSLAGSEGEEMEKNAQDELARAYARLSALRNNIDKMKEYSIPEKYVEEFHTVLDRIKGIGIDTSEFRVPDSEVKPRVTMTIHGSGGAERIYSEEKYVDKPFILSKLDAILSYFEIITSEKPKKIGFRTSDQ